MGYEGWGAFPGEGSRGDSPPALCPDGGPVPLCLGDQIDLSGQGNSDKVRPGRDRSGLHLLDDVAGEDRVRWSPELPPGHFMQVRNGEVHIRRFWDFHFQRPEDQLDWPVGKIADTASELLLDATRIRLRADVPVGSDLSGGLDSSSRGDARPKKFSE